MTQDAVNSARHELADRVASWVGADIISKNQGDSILRFEGSSHGLPEASTPAGPETRRLGPVAEYVSYLGIVLILASGALFIGHVWTGIGVGGQCAVGIVIALLGFIGARAIEGLGDERASRLSWFLWLCGTGGIAMATSVVVYAVSHHNTGWTSLMSGLVVSMVSGALWRNRERPLQFASFVAGAIFAIMGIIELSGLRPASWVVGLIFWSVGLSLGLLAIRTVRPFVAAAVVSQGFVFFGALAITATHETLGIVLGLLGTAAGVALGLWSERIVVTSIGVLWLFIYVVWLLARFQGGPATMLVAFVAGIGIVTFIIRQATRKNVSPSLKQLSESTDQSPL